MKQLDFKRIKLSEHQDSVQALRSAITGLREERLALEKELADQHKLEEDKTTIAREDEGLEAEIKVKLMEEVFGFGLKIS